MIFLKNRGSQKYIALILVAIFVASSISFSVPKRTNAIAVVEVGANLYANLAEKVKDYALDPLVNAIGVALIRTMSDNIRSWVQNGFDGDPLFVTDWENFLEDAGNEAFGIFVDDLIRKGAPDICSPFRINVILGLISTSRPSARCTLDRFINNINSVYNNFETYGWEGFASITTANVANNSFGSTLLQMDELTKAILKKTTGLKQEAQASGGFLSWKECTQYEIVRGGGEFGADEERRCKKYKTVTPGTYVATKLSLPEQYAPIKAAVADEINELISVVAQELLDNALYGTSRGGVLRSRSSRQPDYSVLLDNSRVAITPDFETTVVGPEKQYVAAKQKSANALIKNIQILNELASCSQQTQDEKITEAENALNKVKVEFSSADVRLARYENILRRIQITSDPAELSNLGAQTIDLQNEARSQTEIDNANQQEADLRADLDINLNQLGSCLNTDPFIAFAAYPASIIDGESSTLSWSSINTESCLASSGWIGSKLLSGEEKVFPAQTTSYQIQCSGSGTTKSKSVIINVIP